MNALYDVVSGFRRLEEAEAYAKAENNRGNNAEAVLHGDKPVVIVKCNEAAY